MEKLGRWQLDILLNTIEPFTLGFIGQAMDWTLEECWVLVAYVKNEVRELAKSGL